MACITKRRGRYVLDFYDQTGKRRWKTLKEGTTKEEARNELRAIEEQVDRGAYLSAREIPTFKKVAVEWLKHKEAFSSDYRLGGMRGAHEKPFWRPGPDQG